ncbi:hypothetical protein DBL05_23490 [Pseudomonas putida]|nr:hypothetical protein DBL05_23490 [Pseudomonas putida]
MDTGRRVGAGLPAKRPCLLANLHQPFTVAATTVFAGKPAPTRLAWRPEVRSSNRKFNCSSALPMK